MMIRGRRRSQMVLNVAFPPLAVRFDIGASSRYDFPMNDYPSTLNICLQEQFKAQTLRVYPTRSDNFTQSRQAQQHHSTIVDP